MYGIVRYLMNIRYLWKSAPAMMMYDDDDDDDDDSFQIALLDLRTELPS